MTLRVYFQEGVGLVPEDAPVLRRALGLLASVIEAAPEPEFPIHVRLGVAETDQAIAQVQGRKEAPGDVFLLVSRGVMDRLSDDEVRSLFAHELGHVHHQHLRGNRGFIVAWMLASSSSFLAMWVANAVGWSDASVSWAGVGVGLTMFLVGRNWLLKAIQGMDELVADRFSARLMGTRMTVRTIRRAGPLFGPDQARERGWKVGRQPPSNHFRICALFKGRHHRGSGFRLV